MTTDCLNTEGLSRNWTFCFLEAPPGIRSQLFCLIHNRNDVIGLSSKNTLFSGGGRPSYSPPYPPLSFITSRRNCYWAGKTAKSAKHIPEQIRKKMSCLKDPFPELFHFAFKWYFKPTISRQLCLNGTRTFWGQIFLANQPMTDRYKITSRFSAEDIALMGNTQP